MPDFDFCSACIVLICVSLIAIAIRNMLSFQAIFVIIRYAFLALQIASIIIRELFWITLEYLAVCHRKRKSLKHKVVLVTGAGNGIGRELCYEFIKQGALVYGVDLNEAALKETSDYLHEEIGIAPGKFTTLVCDVSDREQVEKMAERVHSECSHVSVLVNNAGVVSGHPLLELTGEQIERTVRVNLLAHFWTTKSFLRRMLMQRDGHIVTIASVAGFTVAPRLTDYCASKYAAIGFNECLDAELTFGTYDYIVNPDEEAAEERGDAAKLTDERDGRRASGYQINRHTRARDPNAVQRNVVDTTLVCPYYVRTTKLFQGCRSTEPFLFPELTAQQVAAETVRGVITRRKTVYLPPVFYAVAVAKMLLPSSALNLLLRFSGADHFMDTFSGGHAQPRQAAH